MDDDDFGGFEAAETFEFGDTSAQHPVSPAIPWAAFSSVPGMKLSQSAPPDLPLDQTASSSVTLLSGPLQQSDTPRPVPVISAQEEQQAFPVPCEDSLSAAESTVTSQKGSVSSLSWETQKQLQQTLSSLQAKLSATEEEKSQIKKDLEEMMEKHAKLEEEFLKDKETEAEAHKSRYADLQEKHNKGLEEMRKAGHEALTIIVEEFKEVAKEEVKAYSMLKREEKNHSISAVEPSSSVKKRRTSAADIAFENKSRECRGGQSREEAERILRWCVVERGDETCEVETCKRIERIRRKRTSLRKGGWCEASFRIILVSDVFLQ